MTGRAEPPTARSEGFEHVRLSVLEGNRRAVRFFEALGYGHERTLPGGPDGHDQHRYRKRL